MFEAEIVGFTPSLGGVSLTGCPILADKDDWAGVHIAARSLSEDFTKVTDKDANPVVTDLSNSHSADALIIVGTIEKSEYIKALVQVGKLDVSEIEGRWECYLTKVIDQPFDNFAKALVIVGSDKRGAIYGIYTVSNQIGISPWHFWSDVPPKKHPEIYALDVATRDGPPSIKYRGIFINDEAPALAGWVHEKFGPVFNVEFYKHVFDLLLRLKANFLWPAMWFGYPDPGQSFFTDDPLNQKTANDYGIVVSTSHHEPMQRASNEWFSTPYNKPDGSWSWGLNKKQITNFFEEGAQRAEPFESYITMGMRGEGDRKIAGNDPLQTLREVLGTQRNVIGNVYGKADGPPQLLALYKEVQEQYSAGLEIPDDITLLFSDDNYGSVRRLPDRQELSRRGGNGIYYHFEYVGWPRSYMWMNSNHMPKVWQQLDHAYNCGARQLWIFNVGDIKPMEVPLTFALTLAWDTKRLSISELPTFFDAFVNSVFSFGGEMARNVASLLSGYDRLVALRKHDHIEADTFSIINYNEAEGVEQQWKDLLLQAQDIYGQILDHEQPAFFQLILHPIKASSIFMSLRVAQAKNKMYALQRRNSANTYARQVLNLFDADFDLSQEYHQLLDGKWRHILRQPHLGYGEIDFAPSRDMIDGISYVQIRQHSNPIAGQLGITVEGHAGVRPGLCCEEADRTHPTRRDLVPGVTLPPMEPHGPGKRWFELFSRDLNELDWTLVPDQSWVNLSQARGHMKPTDPAIRIHVTVEWDCVPADFDQEVLVELRSSVGDFDYVHVPVKNHKAPIEFVGFVESDHHVSMHATKISDPVPHVYDIMPFLGRTGDGAVSVRHGANKCHTEDLQYPFYLFTEASEANVILYFTFTLDTTPEKPLTYELGVDDCALESHQLLRSPPKAGDLPPGWIETVMDCAWTRKHSVYVGGAGAHILKVRLNEPNCVLEKLVVDLGGVRESYLGPPQSYFQAGLQ